MNAEEKNRYFQELTLNLQHEGFAVKPESLSLIFAICWRSTNWAKALQTWGRRPWQRL